MNKRTLSLFAGAGMHCLGLEWAGFEIVGQVEIDDFCTKILEKLWPKVKRWRDITTVPINDLRRLKPGLITGGFPCQNISVAGKQAGVTEGEKSSLWRSMWRIIEALRPDYVLLENVPALRTNGADTVLAAMEALDYTCWPLVVGAWAVGAPHKRNRVFIAAEHVRVRERRSLRESERRLRVGDSGEASREIGRRESSTESGELADSESLNVDLHLRWGRSQQAQAITSASSPELGNTKSKRKRKQADQPDAIATSGDSRDESSNTSQLADASGRGFQIGRVSSGHEEKEPESTDASTLSDADRDALWLQSRRFFRPSRTEAGFAFPSRPGEPQREWEENRIAEFPLGRPVDGRSSGLVRSEARHRNQALKAIGNGNPPQLLMMIGRAIMRLNSEQSDSD